MEGELGGGEGGVVAGPEAEAVVEGGRVAGEGTGEFAGAGVVEVLIEAGDGGFAVGGVGVDEELGGGGRRAKRQASTARCPVIAQSYYW